MLESSGLAVLCSPLVCTLPNCPQLNARTGEPYFECVEMGRARKCWSDRGSFDWTRGGLGRGRRPFHERRPKGEKRNAMKHLKELEAQGDKL